MEEWERGVWLGRLTVSPEGAIQAGSYGTWTVVYTVGRYGIDSGGRLRLLFRYAWDGGVWQTDRPEADNYTTVRSSRPGTSLCLSWDPRGGRRPWMQALVVAVADEPLAEGDEVVITLGDRSGGSRGHRAQTFVQWDFLWLLDIEAFESGTWIEVPACPICPIVPVAASQLTIIGPSEAVMGEDLTLVVKHMDPFGNPAAPGDEVVISAEDYETGRPVGVAGPAVDRPVFTQSGLAKATLHFGTPGVVRVGAEDAAGRRAWSNPIRVLETPPALWHYWGDLHAQYGNGLGTGSVREAMRYARDAAAVSFVGHQPNDFQLTTAGWDEARRAIPEFHAPGRFIPFLGYEWSGNTPAGGDRNVHFLEDDGPLHRSSHWHVDDKRDAAKDRYPLSELYRELRGRADVLLVPHVGGRRCDITRYHDPELEPVIEICSCHGRFEWLLREAITNGQVVGVVGGSDDHTGRPGAAFATHHAFGTRGGLTAIFVTELSRRGIFAALRARHCYATTGERIDMRVETADGHLMGDLYQTSAPPLIVANVVGTAPLESVEVWRDLDLVHEAIAASPPAEDRVRLQWSGARVKGRNRHTSWNGRATVEGGRILGVREIAFDSPGQGVKAWDRSFVEWISTTSGDHDALELRIEGADSARICVETPLITLAFAVAQLRAGPVVRDCGGVDQRFVAALAPSEPGPRIAEVTWTDPRPKRGRSAYWLRVTQSDGEMAWSSPIYVELDHA